MYLNMTCERCKVASHCDLKGTSPLILNRKEIYHCRIVGNYGRDPIDQTVLSEESKQKVAEHGPCLTIAEIPVLDDSGVIVYQTKKIFSEPILHDREKKGVGFVESMLYPNGQQEKVTLKR